MTRLLLTGRLMLLAALLTLGIVLLGNLASTMAVGRQLSGSGGAELPPAHVLLLHAVCTGIPFVCLALFGERRRTMWTIAAAVMASFWLFFVWQLRQDYLADFAGGVNIGLGLVMLASPLVALLILAAAALVLRRRR
nr:hypothetical protein [uncultured Sphingomonas sp.]